MKNSRLQLGFTLLEVLVASVILIAAIAAISLSYRGALIASERADKNIQISGVMPMVLSQVSQSIKSQDKGAQSLNGDGSAWGVSFKWVAELEQFKAAPVKFEVEQGIVDIQVPRFRLWQVSLIVSVNNTSKTYSYKELSWLDAKR